FQKRGLPHSHILLWLQDNNKVKTGKHIDAFISAEIPSLESDPEAYGAVTKHMLHGPCGNSNKSSPCMQNGQCTKYLPKPFYAETTLDAEGFPVYRRRENGVHVKKGSSKLDKSYVVPYNQCRYISLCEAVWHILGFDIHYSWPAVIRLSFHLPGQNTVTVSNTQSLANVLEQESSKQSKFNEWFNLNKTEPIARTFTYAELPNKFVWNAKEKMWNIRKSQEPIGRIV
ncbi:hypothetical protein V2J09_011114, partial [Rumex salicifolius]